jgi:hypothetical protein
MVALSAVPVFSAPRIEEVSAAAMRQQIEDDWLKSLAQPLTT